MEKIDRGCSVTLPERLDFAALHKEKLEVIFENIDILSTMKENDTTVPLKFFNEATGDVISDYKAKMGILNKNTRFVIRELKKDFRSRRKLQKRQGKELRRQRVTEIVIYVLPVELIHDH